MKATDVLTREEIRELTRASDARGWLAVATTWTMIAMSFALVAKWPSPLSVAVALVVLGGRHLALAILMHDASHFSLFRTRRLNDRVGAWLCAYPAWQDLRRYRKHHQAHHRLAGSPEDPDYSLVRGYPTSRASLARKLLRDLSGLTGLKRVHGLLLIDFGLAEYTVAAELRRIPRGDRSLADLGRTGARNLAGAALTNAALFAALALSGHPSLFLLWAGAYLTTFSAFLRIRSIAEHAVTDPSLDPFRSTRTVRAGWLARITVAPIRVNFHLEHHLLMSVPHFRLPGFHRRLRERGALEGAHVARGYLEVLRLASRRA